MEEKNVQEINSSKGRKAGESALTILNVISTVIFYLLAFITIPVYVMDSNLVGVLAFFWLIFICPICALLYIPTLVIAVIGFVTCMRDVNNEKEITLVRQRLFFANIVQIILSVIAFFEGLDFWPVGKDRKAPCSVVSLRTRGFFGLFIFFPSK